MSGILKRNICLIAKFDWTATLFFKLDNFLFPVKNRISYKFGMVFLFSILEFQGQFLFFFKKKCYHSHPLSISETGQ